MSRMLSPLIFSICLLLMSFALKAQSPAASSSPSATPVMVLPKTVAPTPSASATPARPPSREELVDSLSAADVQTALSLLKKNFTNSDAVDETQLNRAALDGLLVRLNKGVL